VSEAFDAIVIGAGTSGLIAAAYLAKGGARTCMLEAETVAGGLCADTLPLGGRFEPRGAHGIYALDPKVVSDLGLARCGLKFAAADLPTVLWPGDGAPLALGRSDRAAAAAVARYSLRDAENFSDFRRKMASFARAMRAQWWDEGVLGTARSGELKRYVVTGAAAFLDGVFESETVKAAFAFDAMAGGMSPAEAGSSLLLFWRAAQQVGGRAGAMAFPEGGFAAVVGALSSAAGDSGAKIRLGAPVARLVVSGGKIAGVQLQSGEEVKAPLVLSSLSRRKTLLELAPPGAAGLAESFRLARRAQGVCEAKLVLRLNTPPAFAAKAGRYLFADSMQAAVIAHAEARAGRLPDAPTIEAVMPDRFDPNLAPPGKHVLSLVIRPLPFDPAGGWPRLVQKLVLNTIAMLERHAPGLRASIDDLNLAVPLLNDDELCDAGRLVASWRERTATPVAGLYLSGNAAEPVPCLSGRAARIAARHALAFMRSGR
jgi:phytoene dehydrogenase-like protein